MLNTTDAAMMSNMVASDAVVRAHYTHTHTQIHTAFPSIPTTPMRMNPHTADVWRGDIRP